MSNTAVRIWVALAEHSLFPEMQVDGSGGPATLERVFAEWRLAGADDEHRSGRDSGAIRQRIAAVVGEHCTDPVVHQFAVGGVPVDVLQLDRHLDSIERAALLRGLYDPTSALRQRFARMSRAIWTRSGVMEGHLGPPRTLHPIAIVHLRLLLAGCLPELAKATCEGKPQPIVDLLLGAGIGDADLCAFAGGMPVDGHRAVEDRCEELIADGDRVATAMFGSAWRALRCNG